ncbi:MAG TPA: ABC transporter ATP-binding protein [Puia sp.]|jgi:ATP-binding cassette subfamily B protein|nr:ABC transporter ATP-binding protein [Puia sp.]
MGKKEIKPGKPNQKGPGITSLLKPYRGMIFLLIFLALISNGINLILPRIIASGIDAYPSHYLLKKILIEFLIAAFIIFIFTYLQSIIQTNTAERVARDLRSKLSSKISIQSYSYIDIANPSKLLTNLTADVDSVKLFISQAIVTIASSLIIIIGACFMLFSINWKLAFAVITIIPIIGGAFYMVTKRVRPIFLKGREIIDRLNKVINESILGSALIRVINSQQPEYEKFLSANDQAKNLGLSILRLFAWLIPIIVLTANFAGITILALGGHFVIINTMTVGDFAAFNSYLSLLIFPIILIGFMSNVIAQSSASYQRLKVVLDLPDTTDNGTIKETLKGNIALHDVSVVYGQKPVLKHIGFSVDAGSTLAIIGPTAAGKSQLLYLLTGLIKANEGTVLFDNRNIEDYNKENFYSHVGFVFQDSIIFNMSIRENIAFSDKVTDESLAKAIETAELKDYIDSLPEKLNTIVSERGTSLSGGQKQRIMLARALAINPRILLLDDFTARVDTQTEIKILQNVRRNYPGITLISVTQRIASAGQFDQVIVLMEGEIVASGTHGVLMNTSTEYVQIYQSQQSTHELQPQ